MTGTDPQHVIHYRVDGGRWWHGRTVPSWSMADPQQARIQRSAVRTAARSNHPGEDVRIDLRVLPEDEGWALLDAQPADA